jgi:hypothetical protein
MRVLPAAIQSDNALLVRRPANYFLKAAESQSLSFKSKAPDKASKIVKLFMGQNTRLASRSSPAASLSRELTTTVSDYQLIELGRPILNALGGVVKHPPARRVPQSARFPRSMMGAARLRPVAEITIAFAAIPDSAIYPEEVSRRKHGRPKRSKTLAILTYDRHPRWGEGQAVLVQSRGWASLECSTNRVVARSLLPSLLATSILLSCCHHSAITSAGMQAHERHNC